MVEVVYGPNHAKSLLGILKILEILTCLLAVILIAVRGGKNDLINAFYAATIIGIILSLLILVLSLTEAGRSFNGLLRYQFVCHLVMFIFLLVVSSILLARHYTSYHRVGAIFGIIAAVVYLLDSGASYKAYNF